MRYLSFALTATTIFGSPLRAQNEGEYKDAEEDSFPEEYLYTEVDYADHRPFEQLTIIPNHRQSFSNIKKEIKSNNSMTVAGASSKCPHPSWKMFQDSCFKHFTEVSSWLEAKEKCQSSSKA